MRRMVHICCNDDNGSFCGKVSAMQIMGLDLAPSSGWPLKISVEANRLKIGRRWYSYRDSAWSVGNVYWNGYWMANSEAKRLLRDLRSSSAWTTDGGPTRLYDWFEQRQSKAA
jgi:hypothetical protein